MPDFLGVSIHHDASSLEWIPPASILLVVLFYLHRIQLCIYLFIGRGVKILTYFQLDSFPTLFYYTTTLLYYIMHL